jgi:DNA repair photolyase
MKYTVEMGSDVMIYVPVFIKIGSGTEKFVRGIHKHRMMRGIYEALRWHKFRCHDIHTKFHKDRFRH